MSDEKNNQADVESLDEAVKQTHVDSQINSEVSFEMDVESEATESEPLDLASELEKAQEEINKLKDAYLRAKAEEDNIRRRSEKEIANSRKFAVEGFAKEMLNVRDSLKLACDVDIGDDASDAVKSIHDGVGITLKQLDSVFNKFSLLEVSPDVGDKLDANLHQAMSLLESEEVESGCIINVIQAGCQLHDRLLRPALVIVAK